MQTVDVLAALSIIKYLLGAVSFLLAGIGITGGYFLKKIHNTIINDHELLTKISTEHDIFHRDDINWNKKNSKS